METFSELRDFAHPELGQEVAAIAGHYVFGKEIRLPYDKREVLYFVGYAVLDSTCCGVGGVAYVLVAGFIQKWKFKKDHDNRIISRIESVSDPAVQKDIRKAIQKKEMVYQVTFT